MEKRPFIRPETRKAIVALLECGATYQQAATAFHVGVATVNRIWRRFRTTGSAEMGPRGGGQRPAIAEKQRDRFRNLVRANSDATYDELTVLWNKRSQRKVSRSVIVRMVKKLGFTLKKKTSVAIEKKLPRNRAKMRRFRQKVRAVEPEKLVYMDESGFSAGLHRTRARALCGEKASFFYPSFAGRNITICGAVRASGPVVMEGKPKTMTRRWFLSFLRNRLFPRLSPGDTLVLDNLSAHRGTAVRHLARRWSIRLLYLPPYSPEFNAIEMVWAWMKSRLRARINRLRSCFRYAIAGAWRKSYSLNFPAIIAKALP